jgi:hypothetical protein
MKESAVCGEMCERETFNRIEKVRTILRIRLEYLHHIGHQIRQLLIDFDFLQILFYPRSLSPTFVRNALHIGFHDANVTGEEMNALSQFGNGHMPRLFVFDRCIVFRRGIGLLGLLAFGAVTPDVFSFQVVGAHSCG